ncbi:MAG: SpoIIE family protein phosphatase [Leptospiraceae bacterium]
MLPRLRTLMLLIPFLATGCREPTVSDVVAVHGVLDLQQSALDSRSISLAGEWAYYEGILVSSPPEAIRPEIVSIPGPWNDYPGKAGPEKVGTYHLRILLPETSDLLALRIEGIYTAWAVYADGHLLIRSGKPGTAASSIAGPRSGLVFLPSQTKSLDLTIPVSNFHYREGGIRKPIRLGPAQFLLERERLDLSWDLFLAGAFSIVGLYHIFMFAVRRRTHAPAFFGLHCLSIAIRPLTTGQEFLFHQFALPGWHFYLSLEYCSLPLSVFFFLMFLWSLFPDPIFRPGLIISGVSGLILLLTPFFLDSLTLSQSVGYYQAQMLLSGAFGLFMLGRAVYQNRDNSLAVLMGGIPLFLGVLNDVLSARGTINTIQFGEASLLAFVFLQSALLSFRYARSFNRVEELSHELSEKNRDLQRLDELKDDFLANTSHELRTPLHGIIGITESVLQGATGKISEQTRENLRLVAASGRRLTTLVNDILDFSRANHGDLVLQLRKVEVPDAVDVALSLVRPLLRDKPVDLIHRRSEVSAVLADPERLSQILINLLGNAIKFTNRGRIEVEALEEGEFVRISVRDTGIGIPENRQDAIFESFTQADGSISRKYSGTGLGLSITRHLVLLHGGEIDVNSSQGRGSEFSFTLPVFSKENQASVEQSDLPVHPLQIPSGSTGIDSKEVYSIDTGSLDQPRAEIEVIEDDGVREQSGNGVIRTLVVDDDPVNLQVLRNFLSAENHVILEASSGTEALTALQEFGPVDLVLLDVMMPGLTGYEVCRILRQSHSYTDLPIVLLTARSRTQDVVEGLASGANDYLAKPFEPEELRARVQNILALKEAARTQADMAVIQNELSMARMIQQSLIPETLPSPQGIKIAHLYRSMVNVGGDFYDFQQDERSLSLIIADVSGHGVPAALIVSVLKMAYVFQGKESILPHELLAGLNEMLYGNVGHEFVTACALQIDLEKKVLYLANAGHPPLLHWKKSTKEIAQYRPFGRPMGLLTDGAYELSQPVSLESGDRVFIYTDGAFEASSPEGVLFGMEELVRSFAESTEIEIHAWLTQLMDRLIDYSGGPGEIDDDIAVIAIEVE